MLVSHQRSVTLQEFTQDVSDAHNLMDNEHQNPPQNFRHASWLLILKVCGYIDPMLVKTCGHLYHVDPACVANERALAPFVRDKVLLPTKIR